MYSKQFLQSTGQTTGDTPFAKGKVESIKDLGGLQIATIDWKDNEIPCRVNVKNLVRVTEKGVMDRD